MEPDIFQKYRPLWYEIMKKINFNSWIELIMHGVIIVTYTTTFAQISNVQSRRRSYTGATSGSRSMPDVARNFYCAISAPEMHGCNLGQPKLNMCNFGHTGSGTQFLLYYLGAEAVRVQSRAAEAARVQSRACPIAYIGRVHKRCPTILCSLRCVILNA